VQSLREEYPAALAEAYIEGHFTNLTTGTVYSAYNREAHDSNESIQHGETLFIGCDFNVTKMACTVYVKRNGVQWHAVEELCDMYDTPDMIRIINERYANKGHRIVMYPDASGAARKSSNASISDIAQLRGAGFEVRAHKRNPDVRDRIAAVNRSFSDNRIFINSRRCPTVANCLEQQAYTKNGEPDKDSGTDHQNDATTYPIAYEMPIRRPAFAIDFTFMT